MLEVADVVPLRGELVVVGLFTPKWLRQKPKGRELSVNLA
jgi:hypothetical protein